MTSVSVVVLTYNSGSMIVDCLTSIVAQVPPPNQIVCVDNGSSDGTVERVAEHFPQVTVVPLPENLGSAAGLNRGIEFVAGDLLALLNDDLTLAPDYIALCVAALDRDPELGGVTGKLLRPGPADPPIIDSTGHTVRANRCAVDRGEGEPDTGQYDAATSVFSICGAAAVYRRAMLDDVAFAGPPFDEDYFMYWEDFDLAWRAQLRGWRFAYVPTAVGRHVRGGSGATTATAVLAYNHRNRLLTILHNDDPRSFLRHLPAVVYTEARAAFYLAYRRPLALLRAWFGFFALLPAPLPQAAADSASARQTGRSRPRAMTSRWISLVPSPISRILASR